ncbi:unnamed protein product [Rotaria socialis]|uniref:Uncharacterized protein n=1 Tax=Rotaria socialis TaxID=392032 RepID=A0A818LX16_9BILA|nr:unnamed protein product [Rotaria socialis]CAF3585453.1 unnamed protein product [Rotaria socialis]CAF3751439.1 unnamed protein product [Rotaria socialis]CAF4117138.1 unnamed protein product [Rotaria socialis]CAF4158565.1 unnamed protein product [Rotaria socialis]
MSHRSKVLANKFQRHEHELRIITNPIANPRQYLLEHEDYEAPLTANALVPKSKWIIVRNNIHKIRSWGTIDTSHVDERMRDWYIFFQMRRELRRAQAEINEIEHRPDFRAVRYFNLPTDSTHVTRFDVSHVKSTDSVYYPGLGHDPIVIQSLLFYFSKECAVPYSSIFRTFLSDVCAIIYRDQQQRHRAAVFRKLVLSMTVIVSLIIALMLASMIFGASKTASNLAAMYKNDPDGGYEWRQPKTTLGTTLDYL